MSRSALTILLNISLNLLSPAKGRSAISPLR